ncbi:hypothetical protein F511_19318 [Dorcoceras hygrometricum]|uniref:Uncharacterized protein n=1 Tax=Dorcoceras hygrometricum TaxID=472368 RepID=A0A2Z7BLV8_9LAMI|nr:hypothetical protein F511_19318 [Dorcoceras hygrometricum]
MTSAVTSSFSRNYSDQQMKIQQMRRGARFGMSCDDISLDVITISRRSEAQKLKRRRVENQQLKQSTREEATSYGDSADGLMLMTSSMTSSSRKNQQQTKLQCIQSQRKDIQSQEDSGEAFDGPDASAASSRWEIQSRAHMNQLLLINQSQALHIQSTWFPGAKN